MKYLINYWQGNHSLARAFWINSVPIIAILVSINIILEIINNPETILIYARFYSLLMVVAYVVIVPWQVIGLTCTLIRYIKNEKKVFLSLLTSVLVLFELFVLAVILFNSQQKLKDSIYMSFSSYEKGGYEVLIDNSYVNAILVKGKFNLGISSELERVLDDNPLIKTITFASRGGLGFEGKKMFSIIKAKGLNTYVADYCFSACVFAFIGGNERQLSPKGLLGFHQPSGNFTKRAKTKEELSEKLYEAIRFFKQQGVDKRFVMKYFKTPPDELWYSSNKELLKNGVITKVL
jgi:hypothetical protein